MKLNWKVVQGLVIGLVTASMASAQLPPKALSEFRGKIKASYGAEVLQVGKQVQIRMDAPKITETIYLNTLPFACLFLGAQAKQVAEIAVLNKFGAQGYVYESRNRSCEWIANDSSSKARLTILGATHLF